MLKNPNVGREAIFTSKFRDDLRYWAENDRKTLLRLLDLVEAIMRDPFVGLGKPEPLKFKGANIWSRRLAQEHRVVYRVNTGRIEFLQVRFHY